MKITNKLKKIATSDSLPKASIGIGVLIIVTVIVIFVIKLFKKKQDETVNTAKNKVDKNKLSYNETQYGVWADKIEEATDGFGTDEDVIYAIFESLQNLNDVYQLITAYGKRWYPDKLIPYKINLSNLLAEELDLKELSKVNDILKSKNINFKF